MLYQNKRLGRLTLYATLHRIFKLGRRPDDADIIAMKPHLLRDIGLETGPVQLLRRIF